MYMRKCTYKRVHVHVHVMYMYIVHKCMYMYICVCTRTVVPTYTLYTINKDMLNIMSIEHHSSETVITILY